jgi:hypothetical protein
MVIVIENKITARDVPEQLRRYRKKVRNQYSKFECRFIYWALNGDAPQDANEEQY